MKDDLKYNSEFKLHFFYRFATDSFPIFDYFVAEAKQCGAIVSRRAKKITIGPYRIHFKQGREPGVTLGAQGAEKIIFVKIERLSSSVGRAHGS